MSLKYHTLLQAFGRGRQVPKRIYTIEELRLNKLEPEKLLSPTDVSLNTVRNIAQGAAAAGLVALAYFAGEPSWGSCVCMAGVRICVYSSRAPGHTMLPHHVATPCLSPHAC